jgi:hypothetical protein
VRDDLTIVWRMQGYKDGGELGSAHA